MSDMQVPTADSTPPDIDSFEGLVAQACAEPEPTKLLVVLVGVEPIFHQQADGTAVPAEGEGSLTPMMVRDLALTPDLTLADVVEAADAPRQPWQFLMLAVLPGREGRAPTTQECDPHLKRMAKAILTGGDISRFAWFNRAGEPIYIENPLQPM